MAGWSLAIGAIRFAGPVGPGSVLRFARSSGGWPARMRAGATRRIAAELAGLGIELSASRSSGPRQSADRQRHRRALPRGRAPRVPRLAADRQPPRSRTRPPSLRRSLQRASTASSFGLSAPDRAQVKSLPGTPSASTVNRCDRLGRLIHEYRGRSLTWLEADVEVASPPSWGKERQRPTPPKSVDSRSRKPPCSSGVGDACRSGHREAPGWGAETVLRC